MVVVAEGARAGSALTAGFGVSSSGWCISFERSGVSTGRLKTSLRPTEPAAACCSRTKSAAHTPSSIVIAAVVKGPALRVVPVMVIDGVAVIPIESPIRPAPSKTAKEADSESNSK